MWLERFSKKQLESEQRKRALVISDTHTGATTGLISPDCGYDSPYHNTRRKELWKCFDREVGRLGKIDYLINLGDAVHGPSKTAARNDEILINEIDNQALAFETILQRISAEKGVFVMGTGWHVGDTAKPVEQRLAEKYGYEFHKIVEEYNIDGVRFHLKHKIGGSNDPRTLGNVLAKEYNVVVANHARHGVPAHIPDIVLRAHRHVFHYRGDETYLSMITPCLQTWGGNIATELTSVFYPTTGLVFFDILDGHYTWEHRIWKLDSHQEGR